MEHSIGGWTLGQGSSSIYWTQQAKKEKKKCNWLPIPHRLPPLLNPRKQSLKLSIFWMWTLWVVNVPVYGSPQSTILPVSRHTPPSCLSQGESRFQPETREVCPRAALLLNGASTFLCCFPAPAHTPLFWKDCYDKDRDLLLLVPRSISQTSETWLLLTEFFILFKEMAVYTAAWELLLYCQVVLTCPKHFQSSYIYTL